MTHEQRAKKILSQWLFEIRGFHEPGGKADQEIDSFFHHLKEALKENSK